MDNISFFDDTLNDLIVAAQLVDQMFPTAGERQFHVNSSSVSLCH